MNCSFLPQCEFKNNKQYSKTLETCATRGCENKLHHICMINNVTNCTQRRHRINKKSKICIDYWIKNKFFPTMVIDSSLDGTWNKMTFSLIQHGDSEYSRTKQLEFSSSQGYDEIIDICDNKSSKVQVEKNNLMIPIT